MLSFNPLDLVNYRALLGAWCVGLGDQKPHRPRWEKENLKYSQIFSKLFQSLFGYAKHWCCPRWEGNIKKVFFRMYPIFRTFKLEINRKGTRKYLNVQPDSNDQWFKFQWPWRKEQNDSIKTESLKIASFPTSPGKINDVAYLSSSKIITKINVSFLSG